MQYVGQTGPIPLSTFVKLFFIVFFKNNGHSPSKVLIQPVENIIYVPNSLSKLNNQQEIALKKIYNKVTEDIFDMSNERILN